MKKATRPEEQSRLRTFKNTTKGSNEIAQILADPLNGTSIICFKTENLGNHYLNSTMANLGNGHGLVIGRWAKKAPIPLGKPCQFIRYSLPGSGYRKALSVPAHLQQSAPRRGWWRCRHGA